MFSQGMGVSAFTILQTFFPPLQLIVSSSLWLKLTTAYKVARCYTSRTRRHRPHQQGGLKSGDES